MTKDSAKPEEPAATVPFEEALQQLHAVVQQLESGELGLEQSLEEFETAMGLLKNCYGLLRHAEQRVEVLTRLNPDGTVDTTEFDATATLEKSESERSGRSDRAADGSSLF